MVLAIGALSRSVCQLLFPFKLSATGAKRGTRSLPMKTVSSQPAKGRPGPSGDNDDDEGGADDDESSVFLLKDTVSQYKLSQQ